MAIDILSLNATEVVTLIKNDYPLQAYSKRENQVEIKDKLNSAIKNGEVRDLLQLSGVDALKIDSIRNEGGPQRTTLNYSVDVFFRKDMPKIQNGDGTYSISGVKFTEDELLKARNFMKAIAAELTNGGTLDYSDYAKMSIAENSVNSFAKDNFSNEQQQVISKAMREYNAGLEELQERLLSEDSVVSNDYGELSKYYGKSQRLSQSEVDAINKMKEELSRLTGRELPKSVVGDAPGIICAATNTKLISEIKDIFSNIDFNDKDEVNNAMKKYRELIRPAYDAQGYLSRDDSALYRDTDSFMKLIEKLKMSLDSAHIDYSV